jgi:hypothetical protein
MRDNRRVHVEGPKVVTVLRRDPGPLFVSADVHGNHADFARLREIFLASDARGEAPIWISVGDWVHGPSGRDTDVTDSEGVPLYDYPDETPRLLAELFALMDRFPDRVLSITGNHEHAHIGGLRTSKFHRDEAAFLENQLAAAAVAELRRRFAAWPMVIRVPACGLVLTHGAAAPGTAAEYAQLRYAGNPDPRNAQLMRAAMTRYGFRDGEDVELLAQLSDADDYQLLVHGHDREETGYAPAGAASLLLCTSFGARRACKTYLSLERGRRYTLADLREGHELVRLWP